MPGSRNSADHRNVGQAALDAAADAGNRWVFPGTEPHAVRRCFGRGFAAVTARDRRQWVSRPGGGFLAEHRAYLDGLGDHPMADPEFVRAM